MSQVVSWLLALETKPGQKENFHALIREMVAGTSADEPGTQHYEYFTPDDGTTIHIYERYENSDAAMVHLGNFGSKYGERFMGMVDVKAFDVYGAVSDTLREALAGFGAMTHKSVAGFVR